MSINNILYIMLVLVFTIITFGAYVRLSDAGLGCPDWPGCYGILLGVPETASEISEAEQLFKGSQVDIGKAWKEMIHRYLAGIFGLVILAFVYIIYRYDYKNLKKISMFTGLLVLLQAFLGLLTVSEQLQPLIVSHHLVGGLSIFSLIWLIFIKHKSYIFSNHVFLNINLDFKYFKYARNIVYVSLLFLVIQIILGGWTSTNYAALACVDFPKCNTQWWPKMDFTSGFSVDFTDQNYEFGVLDSYSRVAIHFTHRVWALVTFCVLVFSLIYVNRLIKNDFIKYLSITIFLLLIAQIALGIMNVVYSLPIEIAVAHTGNASLLLISLITLAYVLNYCYSRSLIKH